MCDNEPSDPSSAPLWLRLALALNLGAILAKRQKGADDNVDVPPLIVMVRWFELPESRFF
jgi:hypothetical protein